MTLQQLNRLPSWQWPPEARGVLLAVLRDEQSSPSDRRLAASLAGDLVVMDDELAAVLVDLLQNPAQPAEVRARAAISMGPALEEADITEFGEDDPDDLPAISKRTVERIQTALRRTYMDGAAPEEVRRKALEGSVRAPQPWHQDAVAAAYASGSAAWTLTAVFCMRFVKGFDREIVEALQSDDAAIHYEAVMAAGSWGIQEAWPHVRALIESASTDKALLLAAIDAAPTIRPADAPDVLGPLLDSADDDIVDAVHEALAMARGLVDDEEDEEEEA